MANKKKRAKKSTTIVNRRASFDYSLEKELIVGIVLTGQETRSARDSHVQLKGSFVSLRNNELWLNNASFTLKNNDKNKEGVSTVDTSPRKLLAKKAQIQKLAQEKLTGMTIVPIKLLTSGKYIKLVIALGKGKKNYDKRETIKRRDQEREAQRARL